LAIKRSSRRRNLCLPWTRCLRLGSIDSQRNGPNHLGGIIPMVAAVVGLVDSIPPSHIHSDHLSFSAYSSPK
jgi:hypothetical protein